LTIIKVLSKSARVLSEMEKVLNPFPKTSIGRIKFGESIPVNLYFKAKQSSIKIIAYRQKVRVCVLQ